MKYFFHIIMLSNCFVSILATVNNVYASNCEIKKRILTVQEDQFLEPMVKNWKKNKSLNKYCNYYIGQKYFEFYENNKQPKNLTSAITYLEFASQNLTVADQPEYRDCYSILIKAESCKKQPDLEKIYTYNQKIIFSKMLQDQLVSANIRTYANKKIDSYLSNPLHVDYPKSMLSILKKMNIQADNLDKAQNVQELVTKLNNELIQLKVNQTFELVKKLKSLIDQMKKNEIKQDNDTFIAISNLYHYYDVLNNNIPNHETQKKCNLFNKAKKSFQIAKNKFSYINDTFNVQCKSKYACLSSQIQKEMSVLLPDSENEKAFESNLERCISYQKNYTETKNSHSDCSVIDDQRTILNHLVSFYNAYNALKKGSENEPIKKFESLMAQIEDKKDENLKHIYDLSGLYIGRYYYQKISDYLFQDPGENKTDTLNNIESSLKKLKNYNKFIKQEIDTQNEYQLLKQFLSAPDKYQSLLNSMNEKIIAAWNLKDLVQQEDVKHSEQIVSESQLRYTESNNREQDYDISKQTQTTFIPKDDFSPQTKKEGNTTVIQKIDNSKLSPIDRFENLAQGLLTLTSKKDLTYTFVHKYDPTIQYTGPAVNDYLKKMRLKAFSSISSKEKRAQYLYAFALLRRHEEDINNWIENLALAYYNIASKWSESGHYKRKTMIIEELKIAKNKCLDENAPIEKGTEVSLSNARLLIDWNRNTLTVKFLNPSTAKNVLNSTRCDSLSADKKDMFLTTLINSINYHKNSKKKEKYSEKFVEIFQNFLNKECISGEERNAWKHKLAH